MQVCFALEDRDIRWRSIGVASGVAMILLSKSRMGLVGVVACTIGPRLMPLILRGWAWQLLAGLTASLAVLGTALVQTLRDGVAAFKSALADSTRVRETLQRIAAERWEAEAFWFGHGTIQPGPHIVEYMPIGSHHTGWGLLFVKGVTSFFALLVPLVWQTSLALMDATRSGRGRLPLSITMILVLLSFGENIEIEAYLLRPGLLALGIHARELAGSSSRPRWRTHGMDLATIGRSAAKIQSSVSPRVRSFWELGARVGQIPTAMRDRISSKARRMRQWRAHNSSRGGRR